jgi:hypothetical protein
MITTRFIKEKESPEVTYLMRTLINNHSSLGIVRFFAAHPRGRFSKLAIVHAMDDTDSRKDIEKAMADLVVAGVLTTVTENRVCYFRLTHAEPVHGIVTKTADMDWRQWQLVCERV